MSKIFFAVDWAIRTFSSKIIGFIIKSFMNDDCIFIVVRLGIVHNIYFSNQKTACYLF